MYEKFIKIKEFSSFFGNSSFSQTLVWRERVDFRVLACLCLLAVKNTGFSSVFPLYIRYKKKMEVLGTHSCPFMASARQFASSSDGFLAFGDFQFAGFFMFKVFFLKNIYQLKKRDD